jgi:hypothetical protein
MKDFEIKLVLTKTYTNPDTGEVSEEKPLGCFQEKWVADLCRDFLADNDHEPNNDYFIHEL